MSEFDKLPKYWKKAIDKNIFKKDWYCPECEAYLVDERVTFEEFCDNCKTPVILK